MRPTTSKSLASLYWSLVATTVLAAVSVLGIFWLGVRTQTENEWVRHTLAVRNQAAQILILVQQVETSQRGYLLTGRDIYLAPYAEAEAALAPALDQIARLAADNQRQQQTVGRLRQLITDKVRELRNTIDEKNAGRPDAALAIVNSDSGLRLMRDISGLVDEIQREEEQVLAARQSSSSTFYLLLQTGAAAAFLLICAVGFLISRLTRRSFTELETAHDRLVATNQELVRQVADREKAEGQLRQSQKTEAIGQLAGGIAHDFNNMLGVIAGSLDLMQRHIKRGDFAIERYLDAGLQAAKRAATLTHRLLAFGRQQPLSPGVLDANKMIAGMADLLRSTLGEHVRIENVAGAGLWPVKADGHQLENAILNVAINGRDAMRDGGRLTIETANAYLDDAYCRAHAEVEAGQYVMIAVTDTGSGMPPDVAARAFEPFFTTKASGAGTGLGLSQVYGFVKQSRGHIKIYSEVGSGTTIKIYLPRFIGAAQAAEAAPAARIDGGSAREVILVVEDDALMRKLTVESLGELGYKVLDGESGEAALRILDRTPDVALLLTDIVMPDMNGKKLADEALRRRPELKVLYTTGYTPNAVVHGGVLDAGVRLLTKPFTLEQLAAKVRLVLDR